MALVTPRFYFNRVAIESVGQKLDPEALVLQQFDDRAAAREWLRSESHDEPALVLGPDRA